LFPEITRFVCASSKPGILDECCMDSIRVRKEAIRLLFPDQKSTGWPDTTIPHVSPPREEAVIVLFCLIDDAYALLNPRGRRYESLKRLSDSEVIVLALFQQLRGVESERSFLRDAERFFSHLFPGVARLHPPSSFNRRVKRLRRFLEPLRRGGRAGRRARDADRRFDPALGAAPAAGRAVGGF
jgi:hypothetical protein